MPATRRKRNEPLMGKPSLGVPFGSGRDSRAGELDYPPESAAHALAATLLAGAARALPSPLADVLNVRRAGSESVGFAAPNAGGHLLELPSRRPPQGLAPRQSIAAPTCRRPRVRSRRRFLCRVAAAAAVAAAAL